MTILSFDDPGDPDYEIYRGDLGVAVYVRHGSWLVGVVADHDEALALVTADIRRRRREQIDNPTFWLAAA